VVVEQFPLALIPIESSDLDLYLDWAKETNKLIIVIDWIFSLFSFPRTCVVRLKRIEDELSQAVTESFSSAPLPPLSSSNLPPSFTCAICGLTLTRKESLERHLLLHMTNPTESEGVDRNGGSRTSPTTITMDTSLPLQSNCRISKIKFQNRQHERNHRDCYDKLEFPFHCAECGRGFREEDGLEAHMFLHDGNHIPAICAFSLLNSFPHLNVTLFGLDRGRNSERMQMHLLWHPIHNKRCPWAPCSPQAQVTATPK